MKKDKEWLKDEVARIYDTRDYWSVDDLRDEILDSINELDEPEVKQLERKIKELESFNDELIRDNNQLRNELDNQEVLSQEWIDKHKYIYDNIQVVGIKDLQNLLVPKQELPVIPKYVAGYLEKAKVDINLMRVMDIAYNYDEIDKFNKHYDWIRENHELFAEAWLNGYEAEKEPLYYVLDKNELPLLIKLVSDSAVKRANTYCTIKETNDSKFYQLTEQEIKDYDERFWTFAVPVGEEEDED